MKTVFCIVAPVVVVVAMMMARDVITERRIQRDGELVREAILEFRDARVVLQEYMTELKGMETIPSRLPGSSLVHYKGHVLKVTIVEEKTTNEEKVLTHYQTSVGVFKTPRQLKENPL
ncbi:MAG TPA: hypothetical protein VJH55_01125 [Candidatus Paceibacterota bacterium]